MTIECTGCHVAIHINSTDKNQVPALLRSHLVQDQYKLF
jgi:hypothetical protein